MRDVGICVVAARKNAGLTQKELARRSGVDQSALSKYERGCWMPTLSTIERIADGLGLRAELVFSPK